MYPLEGRLDVRGGVEWQGQQGGALLYEVVIECDSARSVRRISPATCIPPTNLHSHMCGMRLYVPNPAFISRRRIHGGLFSKSYVNFSKRTIKL